MTSTRLFKTLNASALVALVTLALGLIPQAQADDRDLFRQAADSPYLFVLFDNTGSMAEETLTGNNAPRFEDDPSSKLFQAKGALDNVLLNVSGVNFGFATFPNQTGLHVSGIDPNGGLPFISNLGESASNHCDGFEENTDSASDEFNGFTFKWPTTTTPVSNLSIGDLVPLDWERDNARIIRERLAPNLALNECTDPIDPMDPMDPYYTCVDYGSARYFEDPVGSSPPNGSDFRLKDNAARPFIALGSTPLRTALLDFKTWHDAWRPLATPFDPALASGCRSVSVILMTDGFDTCNNGDPATAAATLAAAGITVYVVGFAVNNPALETIAVEGDSPEIFIDLDGDGIKETATGNHAYSATSQQGLIDAFNDIVGNVLEKSRTFATAAVPSVVGSAADNIYLTSFSPTDDGVTLWPGRLDSYVKPVPLVTSPGGQQVPDRSQTCATPTSENCLAWDAAAELLVQAPTQAQVNAGTNKVGNANNRRRIYYGDPITDRSLERRRSFTPRLSDNASQRELYGHQGFLLQYCDDPAGELNPNQCNTTNPDFADDGHAIVRYFLQEKQATIANPLNPAVEETIDFVMGDVFHSDPAIIADPKRFDYFARDVEGQAIACEGANDLPSRYPCFVRDQISRRRVLFMGTNEGALHAFDAGVAQRDTNGFLEYTNGSGRELFAYIPRSVMPDIRAMKEDGGQRFTVDGPVTVDDVLIDHDFSGSNALDPADRVWRTVVIGGLREGGKAYYALDVTRPDPIDPTDGLPENPTLLYPGCAGSGNNQSSIGTNPSTNCRGRYPEIKWEWTHDWDEDAPGEPGHGAADLGFTWSKVNTGRIKIKIGTDVNGNDITEDKYVAIFGGGMDPEFKKNPVGTAVEGNYLFMLDIETGDLIYKRRLDVVNVSTGAKVAASVPSEPAAVDTDQDSYIDTIYIGNTAGYLHKVNVSQPVPLETGQTVLDYSDDTDSDSGIQPRQRTVDRIVDSAWDPFPIFKTDGRPIYHPPSVIFVPEKARYAVAFGTGDREDLWSDDLLGGRFYLFLDDGFGEPTNVTTLPLDSSDLESFDATNNTNIDPSRDLIENPDTSNGFRSGFILELDPKERLVAKSFGLSGVVFFSTFLPETITGVPGACASTGSSRLYSVFADNGGGLSATGDRFRGVADFVTAPFVESAGAVSGTPSDPTQPPDDQSACDDATLQALRTSLMADMPAQCDFAQYSLNVMTLQSENGIQCIVPVPVCVIERNWKEF